MKRWQQIAIILLSVLILLSFSGTASASDGDDSPPLLAEILIKIASTGVAIVDEMLGFWVVDSNLTDPAGFRLVGSLVTIVENWIDFLAQFAGLVGTTT